MRAAPSDRSSPASSSAGSPVDANVVGSPSRSPKSTATPSACSRRAAKRSASLEPASTHCASSTVASSATSSAAAASRLSVPAATPYRAGGGLRHRDPLQSREDRPQQVAQCREGELRLGFHPGRGEHDEVAAHLASVFEQCTLPDACLAADDEDPT